MKNRKLQARSPNIQESVKAMEYFDVWQCCGGGSGSAVDLWIVHVNDMPQYAFGKYQKNNLESFYMILDKFLSSYSYWIFQLYK